MSDCIFCRIVSGEVPANKVYEDDEFVAFLDRNPINPGHTLLIPKKHYATVGEAPAEVSAGLASKWQKLSQAILTSVGSSGFNIHINNGSEAGQDVFHLHCHIIPRFAGDGFTHWHGSSYKEGEASEVAERIRQSFE